MGSERHRAGAVHLRTPCDQRAGSWYLAVDLSRFMGTSIAMIDRTYGHLARGGRQAAREARRDWALSEREDHATTLIASTHGTLAKAVCSP